MGLYCYIHGKYQDNLFYSVKWTKGVCWIHFHHKHDEYGCSHCDATHWLVKSHNEASGWALCCCNLGNQTRKARGGSDYKGLSQWLTVDPNPINSLGKCLWNHNQFSNRRLYDRFTLRLAQRFKDFTEGDVTTIEKQTLQKKKKTRFLFNF